MYKKFVLLLIFFFFGFNIAQADIVINEIMYAPASGDSEWVEIFNSGSNSVDLSDWRFFNNKDDSAPLRIQKGFAVLSPGGYAIITTLSASSSFSGVVFSSSKFSLPNDSSKNNTYKAISDSNKQNVNFVTYITSVDALGTGNSLQLINGEWKAAISTPGAQNFVSLDTTSQINDIPVVSSPTQTATEIKTNVVEVLKIKTKIITKTYGFAGLSLPLEAKTLGYAGEQLNYGKYFWNFGDGDSKEIKLSEIGPFTHTYFYPGDYIVSLDYYQNYYSNIPDASDKITIKIVEADILISRVGDEKDFFIELTNNTIYDTDISNWVLSSGQKSFMIPKNTILASKKKIIISPKITNFSILDRDNLKLMTLGGEVVFEYAPVVVESKIVPVIVLPTSSLILPLSKGEMLKAEGVYSEIESPVENLLASAISSNVISDSKNNLYAIVIFVVFISFSVYAVYFIRQKRVFVQSGDDFEILDE